MVLSDDSWEALLQFIDQGQVIPIVGPELLYVKQGEELLLFEQLLAQRLAESLGVTVDRMPTRGALNRVACLYLEKPQNKPWKIYSQLGMLAKGALPQVPDTLSKLAQIRHFNLFVSMTTDLLLEKALLESRKTTPEVIVYNLGAKETDDLPRQWGSRQSGDRPIVFHLMGRMSPIPDYVVTEEDTLEFLHALQSGRRPKLLFDELRSNHLLFIGCNLTNWQARFFMRLAKGAPLSETSKWQEIIVDHHMTEDGELTAFLATFGRNVQIFPAGGAVEFVDELLQRYLERHPDVVAPPPLLAAGLRPKVFLSYAHEDQLAAKKLAAALAQIADVWWDKEGLEPADDWDAKIRKKIKESKLFLPLVSRNTENRTVGYFRREWNWADEHANSVYGEFVAPILIDDLDFQHAKVPERFTKKQACLLPGGEPNEQFTDRVRRLLADHPALELSAP